MGTPISEPVCRFIEGHGGDLVIHVRDADQKSDAQVDSAWAELAARTPRLYDGPVLIVDRVDGSVVHAHRDRYRVLATAATLGRDARALGVQGVVIGRDSVDQQHVLFGRRSSETRIYGGLWENAPSGSVPPSHAGHMSMGMADLFKALRSEGLEELSIDLAGASVRSLGLLDDPVARSLDVVLEVRPRGIVNPRQSMCAAGACGRWEYIDAAWVKIDDLGSWARGREPVVSPPTAALMRHMRWM